MNLPVNIPLAQLSGAASHLRERFGAGKVLGCVGLGCLLPVSCIGLFLLVSAWGFVPTLSAEVPQRQPERGESYASYRAATRPAQPVRSERPDPVAPIYNGQIVQVGPTPVYAPTNAQGGIYRPGVPSMMFNQQRSRTHD